MLPAVPGETTPRELPVGEEVGRFSHGCPFDAMLIGWKELAVSSQTTTFTFSVPHSFVSSLLYDQTGRKDLVRTL